MINLNKLSLNKGANMNFLPLLFLTFFSVCNAFAGEDFILSSPDFVNYGKIPSKFTGDGDNVSPALYWKNPPIETQSFVLIVEDPDAGEKAFVHWIVFNIGKSTFHLAEGTQKGDFTMGCTDFYYSKNGLWQYCGPYPPNGVHRYHFTLFALDKRLDIPKDVEKANLLEAMKDHILAQTQLIGLYERRF